MRAATTIALALAGVAACADPGGPTDEPSVDGMVFSYPVDGQLDVPLGARIVVSFASPHGDDLRIVGPAGDVAAASAQAAGGVTVTLAPDALAPGTTYEVRDDRGPLFAFTTRDDRARAGSPQLVAIDDTIYETSTLHLLLSEPLAQPDGIELVDVTTGEIVPTRRLAQGIRVSLDPLDPLVAGASYELRIDDRARDLGGESFEPTTVAIVPLDGIGRGTVEQTLRMRADGDPVGEIARLDVTNALELSHPMIGTVRGTMSPGAVTSYLGDPAVAGGPIAFTIPRGQRLGSSALDVLLGGTVPSGLVTGDIRIEILTDATGVLHRNRLSPDQPPGQGAPIQVEVTLDLGLFATDPLGNAVLAQSVLGVQLAGLAMVDDGALALELHGALDVDLLGVASASANLVLDVVTDPFATAAIDDEAPAFAGSVSALTSDGVDLLFSEPIDLDRAAAGGVALLDGAGQTVAADVAIHGAVITVRPRAPLAAGASYTVALADVADVAGNAMAPQDVALVAAAEIAGGAPITVAAASPGTACARTGATMTDPGRCAGGLPTDDVYRSFSHAADEPIDIAFDRDVDPRSLTLGAACDDGSVRVESVGPDGGCLAAVPGALVPRRRGLAFVPEAPWIAGDRYRVRLVSGPDGACGAGEVCGANGVAASFDALAGGAGGGPDLVIDFVGAPAGTGTRLFAELDPALNRAALRIVGTSGIITSASFDDPDCVESTPEREGCMYMLGSMPAELGVARADCALPDGTVAASCVPVAIPPQQMYSTSVEMTAGAIGIPISTATGTSVMRVREPASGTLEGYIVERDGAPTMVVALELYMDAPEMSLPIGQHDLHSKPLSILLSGPVRFRSDGRIAIGLSNAADVPIEIAISALGLPGGVSLIVPAGEMKLELLSPPRRSVR
jgi:hypothetical protein